MPTIQETAEILQVKHATVERYLAEDDKLEPDVNGGVTQASLDAYRRQRIPHYDKIAQVREWDGWAVLRLLNARRIDRALDILERRLRFEKLDDIGEVWEISRSRVAAIIRWTFAKSNLKVSEND